jgi:hypothetical protein
MFACVRHVPKMSIDVVGVGMFHLVSEGKGMDVFVVVEAAE